MQLEVTTLKEGPYAGEKLVGISDVRYSGTTISLTREEAENMVYKLLTLVTWERDRGFDYDNINIDKMLIPAFKGNGIEIQGFHRTQDAHWCRIDEAYILAMDMLAMLLFGVGIYVTSETESDY